VVEEGEWEGGFVAELEEDGERLEEEAEREMDGARELVVRGWLGEVGYDLDLGFEEGVCRWNEKELDRRESAEAASCLGSL
jgi:hypothetical protein